MNYLSEESKQLKGELMANHSEQYKLGSTMPKHNHGKFVGTMLAIIMVVALGCGMGFALMGCSSSNTQSSSDTDLNVSDDAAKNPIDFAAYQSKNPDMYAWIKVDGADVDHPIFQHPTNDFYYLTHDMEGNNEATGGGEVYTELKSSKDFTDPVTPVYGHTYEISEGMFTNLHNYEDQDFFDTHKNFQIYTPDKALTYEVVSALNYPNRHLLNTYDFSDEAQQQEFFDSVMNPESEVAIVREGSTLTAGEDKVVALCTCLRPGSDTERYLIIGKLVDEQELQ